MKRSPKYAYEAELCDDFQRRAEASGWTVYPETHNFDLFLVREDIQLGVEAKLRPTLGLVSQIIDRIRHAVTFGKGPTYFGALLPSYDSTIDRIGKGYRIPFITLCPRDAQELEAVLCRIRASGLGQPLTIPTQVPNFGGGRPSPRHLSPWRIKALHLHRAMTEKGRLTSPEIVALNLSAGSLHSQKFIALAGKEGRVNTWRPGPEFDRLRRGYESIEAPLEAK